MKSKDIKIISVTIKLSKLEKEKLLKEDYTDEAKGWLYLAKNSAAKSDDPSYDVFSYNFSSDVSSYIKKVRECAKKAGISLKAIGTTDKKLKEILKESYISEAKKWLNFFRERSSEGKGSVYIKKAKECAKKAGISLKAIEMTEEEEKISD